MAAIIIDGYNLIGIQHRDMEAARERLVRDLISYRTRRGHDITVVFDGWRDGGRDEHREVRSGVVIVYSPIAEKADALIKRMVSRAAEPPIVITTDRDIQSFVWAHGAVAVDSEIFERRLHTGGAGNDYDGDGDDEDDDAPARQERRGNAYKPSKKQRALDRAIRKL